MPRSIALTILLGITMLASACSVIAVADAAVTVNNSVENIGASRLQTVLEKVLEEVSYTASDRSGETFAVDAAYVKARVGDLAQNTDLSRFIL